MKDKLKPKLRFPEFETKDWKLDNLENIYGFRVTNSFSRENLNYFDGEVKNIHYGDIHTKFSSLFNITKEIVPYINPSISLDKISIENYCQEGDIIFADASEDEKDIGKSIEIVHINNELLLSGLHTLHARQTQNKLAVGFGGHLFISVSIRRQIQREAQGAKVLGISASRLAKIKIAYPEDKKEQKKIASCLSSLDDLLLAEQEKLKALKIYKKCLMQQLFPAEGEKTPQLRFLEFKDEGDWDERELGNVALNISSGKDKVDIEGKFNLYGSTGIIGKTNASTYEGDFILIARVGANAGLLTRTQGQFGVTDNTLLVSLAKSENIDFIYYTLERFGLNRLVFGSGQPLITGGQLKALKIYSPKIKEQKKIADFLFSLDEQITEQTDKIESLKLHKKGLLQQLFPITN